LLHNYGPNTLQGEAIPL